MLIVLANMVDLCNGPCKREKLLKAVQQALQRKAEAKTVQRYCAHLMQAQQAERLLSALLCARLTEYAPLFNTLPIRVLKSFAVSSSGSYVN